MVRNRVDGGARQVAELRAGPAQRSHAHHRKRSGHTVPARSDDVSLTRPILSPARARRQARTHCQRPAVRLAPNGQWSDVLALGYAIFAWADSNAQLTGRIKELALAESDDADSAASARQAALTATADAIQMVRAARSEVTRVYRELHVELPREVDTEAN